jgi:NAD(P)-dependent dehydrogenase (short-subunit alcohol dehydrogenase family)
MAAPVAGPIDLRGQTAVVTGAARGIGRAIALTLAREGAAVVAADLAPCDETVAAAAGLAGSVRGARCDVTRPDEVRSLIDGARAETGRVEILVANAGVVATTPLASVTLEEWHRVLAVHLTGTFLCAQAVFPVMQAQGYGKLVLMGSRAGRVGGNTASAPYVAAKGGIHALVKRLAIDGAPHGIFANGIAPGPVKTAMTDQPFYRDEAKATPLGRMGRPEDIAEATLFLASQASHFVTGIILDVAGGLLMTPT